MSDASLTARLCIGIPRACSDGRFLLRGRYDFIRLRILVLRAHYLISNAIQHVLHSAQKLSPYRLLAV
jgi:hypothetical protein